MFCCGKKKEKSKHKEDNKLQKIVPNQEKEQKGKDKESELQEKEKEKEKEYDQVNKEEILEVIKILQIKNEEEFKEKIEPLKESCLNKEEEKIKVLLAAISKVIQDPHKESPQTQINAVQLLAVTFKQDNEKMQSLIAKDILPKYQKISKIFQKLIKEMGSESSFGDKEDNYFGKKNQKDSDSGSENNVDYNEIEFQFLSLIGECIIVWGLWFPKSKFEKAFLKFIETDFEISRNFEFFPEEDGEQLFNNSEAYQKLMKEKEKKKEKEEKKKQEGDFFNKQNMQFKGVMLGLDGSGKTTILYQLKLNEVVTTIPTIGFNVENIVHKNVDFTIYDIGGQDKIRALWRHYYSDSNALIFTIDYSNDETIEPSKQEFVNLLEEEELRNNPILIYANKIDIKPATLKEVEDKLGFSNIKDRKIHIQPCSGTTGDGLKEGLDWLVKQLNDNNK